jgi:hypothetical protein
MSEVIEDNITEQRYLELCEDLKEIVNEKDKDNVKLQLQNDKLKSAIYKIYGITCFLYEGLPELEITEGEQSVLVSIGYIIDLITRIILPNLANPTLSEVFLV